LKVRNRRSSKRDQRDILVSTFLLKSCFPAVLFTWSWSGVKHVTGRPLQKAMPKKKKVLNRFTFCKTITRRNDANCCSYATWCRAHRNANTAIKRTRLLRLKTYHSRAINLDEIKCPNEEVRGGAMHLGCWRGVDYGGSQQYAQSSFRNLPSFQSFAAQPSDPCSRYDRNRSCSAPLG
jgi:hypothetical protein